MSTPSNSVPKIGESTPSASPYIRTFAKDYEALSGNLPDEKGKKGKKPKVSKPPKEKKIKPKKVKPPKKIKEGKVKKEIEHPAEEVQLTPVIPAVQPITPSMHPSQDIHAPISANSAAPLAPLTSAIPTPLPSRPIIPAPQSISTPQPLPQAPRPIPTTPPSVAPRSLPGSSSPLETYSNDFASHIDQTKASRFSVLAAEKDASPIKSVRRKKPSVPTARIVAIILFLILIGGAGGVIAYVLTATHIPLTTPLSQPYLIKPSSSIELTGTGMNLRDAYAGAADRPLQANGIVAVYVNQATTTAQGTVEAPASGGAFISALTLAAPDLLLRNIDPSSKVGVVQAGNQTAPFFVIRVVSYERTYAGMLQWEPTMLEDLEPLYPNYPDQTLRTGTTTQIITDSSSPQQYFVDELLGNLSVRALKDTAGRTILLYGYADRQTLIIARDEDAFQLLVSKLGSSS